MLRQNVSLLVLCIRFQHPIFRMALYGSAHSSSRNSRHANCCLASQGLKTRIFSSTISSLFQSFHQGVWLLFMFFFLLRHRLASFSEVFLSSLFIPDECLNMRMHSCFALHLFFRLARPLPFTAALKVIPLFTGSTVGCIPSMCECLKKGFGKIHLSCLVKRVCSAFTWP